MTQAYVANGEVIITDESGVTFADNQFTIPDEVTSFTFTDNGTDMKATFEEENWVIAEVVAEEPAPEPEPEPEQPVTAPLAPTNLIATVNDDVIGVTLQWQATPQQDVIFKVYLNDVFTGALSSDNQIKLADLIAGETYKANIKAVNTQTMLESEFSNAVYFQVKGLIGSNDPKNWIGVRLDNITVIYQK